MTYPKHLRKHAAGRFRSFKKGNRIRILGLVTHTHDSGVALIRDGVPEMVIEEERLNRQKKTMKFPKLALNAALTERGLTLRDVSKLKAAPLAGFEV